MCDAAQGEHIARTGTLLKCQDGAGAKTLRGWFHPYLRLAAGQDEAERMLIDTLRRRRAVWPLGKARERRSGEIPAEASAEGP
jgi:hypothetical protein